jgi:hypothetical protein
MKKILLLSGFFISTTITLFGSIIFLLFLIAETIPTPTKHQALLGLKNSSVAYAALPTLESTIVPEIVVTDSKEEALRQFFQRYKSPLIDYTSKFIEIAQKYNLDYRLLPAIAMQETNLCAKAKENSYNCWGFGVTAKDYRFFTTYEEGIETVARTLALHYRDKLGLSKPDEIQRVYTPASNGSWADSVNYFMNMLPQPF